MQLSLANNHIGETGAVALARAIAANQVLTEVCTGVLCFTVVSFGQFSVMEDVMVASRSSSSAATRSATLELRTLHKPLRPTEL